MANITNLKGTDKLREAYPVVNQNLANLNAENEQQDQRIDNLVGQSGSSNTEIVDARQSSVKNETFTVLKDRLEEIESDALNSPSMGPNRQATINGGFSVNQRVVSGTVVLSAGQYGHDRWKAGAGGCTYTFSTVNNVTTITITAGSLVQVIEGNNLYSGNYTLSWTGTAQGKIGAGAYGASGVTATVVGGTNLSIEFNTGTLSKAQLNAGDVVLPFQPRSFAEELALCQRYYEKSYDYSVAPGTVSSVPGIEVKILPSNTIALAQPYGKVAYKVPKRITPTITIYPYTTPTNTGRVSNNADVDLTAGSGTLTYQGVTGFNVFNSSAGATTTTDNAIIFHWSTDAEL